MTYENPDIFWVVGSESDLGKTTFACALVKTLSTMSIPTAGFKPYALTLFSQNIDFFLENCQTQFGMLFGGDAFQLAKASPLTEHLDPELIGPSNAFCFPSWNGKFLLRTGSKVLGNNDFYTFKAAKEKVLDRPDIKALSNKIYLPFEKIKLFSPNNMSNSSFFDNEKKSAAFKHLVSKGARAMVLEGGGGIVPAWTECPPVNHVFLLQRGNVSFFSDIDHSQNDTEFHSDLTVINHLSWIKSRSKKAITSIFPIAEAENRQAVLQQLITRMLKKVEYLPNI